MYVVLSGWYGAWGHISLGDGPYWREANSSTETGCALGGGPPRAAASVTHNVSATSGMNINTRDDVFGDRQNLVAFVFMAIEVVCAAMREG